MDYTQPAVLASAIGLVALLYSTVGHAGASGYIAVLTLFGCAAGAIKPTALMLNILVAAVGAWQYHRAGHFPGACSGPSPCSRSRRRGWAAI